MLKRSKKNRMKSLLFMRHGKQQLTPRLNDYDLPLSDKGKRAATDKGEIISQKGIIPDVILSSPVIRAAATAMIVAASCGYNGEIIFHDDFYESDCYSVIMTIKELRDSVNRVLLIGHNPAWTELVYGLQSPHKMIKMDPATLVALSFNGHAWKDIGPGKCLFEWVIQ
jgi:phosphohistidine phosphatase